MCSLCSSFSSWQKGACYKLPLQLWSNLKSHVTTENYLLTVLLYTETHTQTPFLLSFYDSDFLKIPRKLTSKMVLYFECMYLIFHWSHLSWFTIPVLYPVFSKNGFKFNVGLNKLKLNIFKDHFMVGTYSQLHHSRTAKNNQESLIQWCHQIISLQMEYFPCRYDTKHTSYLHVSPKNFAFLSLS